MAKHLIVSEAFGDYAKGSRITDPRTIAEILQSPNAPSVLAIEVADTPSRAKDAAPSTTSAPG